MKVALVHDWLTGMRGGEKCLEVFCELFPDATLFTLLHNKGSVSKTIESMKIKSSFLEKFPGVMKNYRQFLPFFPAAIESFDLSGYDLVISSSHSVAKGIKKAEGALHISYCYTPMRYAWVFFDEYFSREVSLKKYFIAKVISGLKKWDLGSNNQVDYFVAISKCVQTRIREFYNRDADIIYPPVNIDVGSTAEAKDGDFYLIVSALVPYKRVDIAIDAFNASGRKLIVVGDGTDLDLLRRNAAPNIDFPGRVDDKKLSEYYAGCRALIFPQEEDFGIAALEAQGFGKPVIAYGKGGALETIVPLERGRFPEGPDHPTGIFFDRQSPEELNRAVECFEENISAFEPEEIKKSVVPFGRERFKRQIREYIETKWLKHKSTCHSCESRNL